MKEKQKYNYLIKYVIVLAILIVMTVLACIIPTGIDLTVGDSIQDISSNITNTAYNVNYPTSGELGQFDNGVVYVYTDPAKVESCHAGTLDKDVSLVTVDTSYPRGAQKNPYVISTLADWDNFVKKMATSGTSYGSGEYFVLANDIDFSGVTFRSVLNFNGTFYGLGFALKNISCNGAWQYWNGSSYVNYLATHYAYGVFSFTSGTVISDLIVENYEFNDLPQTNKYIMDRGAFAGGIVGLSLGQCTILNCHTVGTMNSSNLTYGEHTVWGGIVGEHYTTANITLYRCTASLDACAQYANCVPVYGGILGESIGATECLSIYDCAASITAEIPASAYVHIGSIAGIIENNKVVQFENLVGEGEVAASSKCGSSALSYVALFTSAKLNNVYVGTVTGASTSTKLPLYLMNNGALTASNSQLSNLHLYKPTSLSYATYHNAALATSSFTSSSPAQPTLHETYADMYAQAQQDVDDGVLPSSIWDKTKIGNYTPADSPVRNFLTANVTFSNLLSGGGEEGLGIATAEYRAGDALPSPSGSYLKPNHTFRGWTMDKTGKSDPVNELPTGVFGDVTFYAVWGLTDSYVASQITTSLSVKDNIRTIEYDSVASITLIAEATHTGIGDGYMTNPSFTYYWKQTTAEGTVDKGNNTTGELNLKLVKDSGDYTYSYRIKDDLEPLWYYDGDYSGNAETLTIEKGKLEHMTIKDFKISSSTVPYFGKKLEDITFTVSMFNNANKEVALSEVKWQSTIGKVDNKGTNTKKIVLCPTDTDNYETQYVFDATFESQSLVIVFNLAQISQKIEVEVEYGQNYGANEIIYLFEQAYLKALSTWDAEIVGDVSSMAPYLDGKALVEGDANADKFDTAYNGINEIHTIEVTFKDASYEVVFNPNNGGAGGTTQETYKYGQFLKKPTDPVNGDLLFVGWYFKEKVVVEDENGNKEEKEIERAWRFNSVGDVPQDRVTKAVELIAKWLKADTLDSIKVEVDPSKKYMAQTSLQEGDLIVTATYSGQVDGQSIEQEVVLSWSDFASGITYSTIDKQLHVTDGGYEVTVSLTYGSTTQSDSILINVLPISVDTSKAKFEDKVVIYDGTDKDERIDEVTWSGARPSQITGVTYIYTLDGAIVEESSLKGLGDYIVQAVFTMRSKDFYADPLVATLSIRSPTALEKPTFTGGVTYDGTEKNIEDYLDGYDSEYMQLVGDVTGTAVGRYTITIQLTDGSWSDGTTGNVTLNWTIDKATLIPEWDNWEFIASDISNGFAPVISSIAQGLASGDSVDYATDFIYKIYDEEDNELSESEVSEVGSYKIVASINASSALYKNYQFDGASNEWSFVVVPQAGMEILTIEWSDTEFLYDGEKHIPTYVVKDRNGNVVENATQILNFSNYEKKTEIATYTIKVTVKDSDRYFIRSGAICKFKIVEELGDEPPEENKNPNTTPSGNGGSGIGSIEDIIKYFKEYPLWQIIAGVISIILIMIFLTKTAGYNSKRKKFNKKAEKLDTVYSVVWGMPMAAWTGIACTLMGLAVVSLVIMLIAKKKCNDAEEEYEERFEEYQRNKAEFDEKKRDENMQMMFMRMMGAQGANMGASAGVGQGGYTIQQGIGVDEMRGLISETVTAMLPGVQQMLPQQASTNDELVGKLIEQNEKLIQQLAEQKSSEKIIEREVASSSVNEETIQRLIDKNDERIEKMMKTQEALIEKLLEKDNAPQVVEKVVEKEVPVEKIVEKVVEVPVEVEKVVEKEVIKEVPAKAVSKPKKEVAPRLTLDEAYALLTKEQKKYFDGLREYALTKYKCKEKKSTYFVVYGQTTTNPLLKLTVKKDTTVALLKMEDEYMKDLRRDATGDGTKVKVKETEVLVSDAQAYETAKKMVDLRYDQIERYQDLLREQRAMKK